MSRILLLLALVVILPSATAASPGCDELATTEEASCSAENAVDTPAGGLGAGVQATKAQNFGGGVVKVSAVVAPDPTVGDVPVGVEAEGKAQNFNNGTIKVSAAQAEDDASVGCDTTGDPEAATHVDCELQGKAKTFNSGTIKVSA